jgi:hypothetical protein
MDKQKFPNFLIGLILITLLFLTYFSITPTDDVKTDILFSLKYLPTTLYYVTLMLSLIVTFITKNHYLRILSIFIFSYLLISTPDVMLINPWLTDTYPFTAEAVHIVKNGHLVDYHYLLENPALGIFLGTLLMVTGIDVFILMKIYQTLLISILMLILFGISKYLKIGKREYFLAPIFFIAIMWPNVFHVSRQSFALIFYFSSWYFLTRLVLHRYDRRVFLILLTQISLMSLSQPATPIYFAANTIAIAIIGMLLKTFQSREIKSFTYTSIFSALFWFLWNSISNINNLKLFGEIILRLYQSLVETPEEVPGISKITIGYSPDYRLIINTRLILSLSVFACGVLLPLIFYKYYKDPRIRKILIIAVGWNLSNIFSAFPLLYSGLPYFDRPILFSFISWAPLAGVVYEILGKSNLHRKKLKKTIKLTFVVAFTVLPSLLMPIMKYSPLPFLYPTTQELYIVDFAGIHSNRRYLLFEFTSAWSNSYLNGIEDTTGRYTLSVYNGNISLSRVKSVIVVTTSRVISRDAFNTFDPSMLYFVEEITSLNSLQNKVYDSGWPYHMIIPNLK